MYIDHINIKAPAPLMQREKQFFCDILGLREGYRPAFSSRGYWLYSGDRPLVHLSERRQDLADGQSGYLDHVAFRSTGLRPLLQRLRDAEIEFTTGYLDELDMTQVFLKSPSATGIEVNFSDERV